MFEDPQTPAAEDTPADEAQPLGAEDATPESPTPPVDDAVAAARASAELAASAMEAVNLPGGAPHLDFPPVVEQTTLPLAPPRSGHDVLDELRAKLFHYGEECEASVRHLINELRGML